MRRGRRRANKTGERLPRASSRSKGPTTTNVGFWYGKETTAVRVFLMSSSTTLFRLHFFFVFKIKGKYIGESRGIKNGRRMIREM